VTLFLIVVGGVLMSALALVGGVTALLPDAAFRRLMLPLVALSAGSLLGGALFHLVPEAVARRGNVPSVYAWVAGGFAVFFCLEQFLHWHHCHAPRSEHHHPVSQLLLIADGVHNLVEGVAVGASFVVDIRLGVVTWLVAAAHELPQELGDFGVLVHAGWSVKKALVYNFLSGLTFLVGGLLAYFVSAQIDLAAVIAFAAGSFVYIAAVDLVPEVKRHESLRHNLLHFCCFGAGLLLLMALKALRPD
jgi:zinc and cadmium transporter